MLTLMQEAYLPGVNDSSFQLNPCEHCPPQTKNTFIFITCIAYIVS